MVMRLFANGGAFAITYAHLVEGREDLRQAAMWGGREVVSLSIQQVGSGPPATLRLQHHAYQHAAYRAYAATCAGSGRSPSPGPPDSGFTRLFRGSPSSHPSRQGKDHGYGFIRSFKAMLLLLTGKFDLKLPARCLLPTSNSGEP